MDFLEQRAYIKARTALNEKASAIHADLVKIHGRKAVSYVTVTRWVACFKAGQQSLQDQPRSGCPITATTPANIQRIKLLIQRDCTFSVNDLIALTDLSHSSILRILHDHLGLRKVSSRWLPHNLTPENKAKRLDFAKAMLAKLQSGEWRSDQILTCDEAWFYHRQIKKRSECAAWKEPCEPPEAVVRRDRYEPKTMYSIFFRSTGLVLVHAVGHEETMTSEYYVENCLKPAFAQVRRERPRSGLRGILLLHDNARPHTAQNTENYLISQGVRTIDHPPYSPDLSPCDYWLFDYIKRNLGDHTTVLSMTRSITRLLRATAHSEFIKTFQKYQERLELCILAEGDYFETFMK